jgi:hypothetical protein
VLALPLLFGAVAYASAGLVFGIGFGRIRRARLAAEIRGPAEAVS